MAAAAKVAAAAAAVTPMATHDDATFPMPQVREVHDHNGKHCLRWWDPMDFDPISVDWDRIIARINDVDDSAT